MTVITDRARAYVYHGDWVADCPRGCGNVEHLFDPADKRDPKSPRTAARGAYQCSYCRQISSVDWPAFQDEIMAVLVRRPFPYNRNWYPSGHDVALRFGLPHGQSVADLIEENAEHGVS